MWRSRSRWVWIVALGVALGAALSGSAEAQRRRRRVAPPVPPPVTPPAAVVTPDPSSDAPGADAPRVPVSAAPTPAAAGAAPAAGPSPTGAAGAGVDGARAATDLEAELGAVMDELVRARARIAALGRQATAARLRVDVAREGEDDQRVERVVVRLDGAAVFEGDGSLFRDEEPARVFDEALAPGPHLVALELHTRARSRAAYRHVLRDAYAVEAVRGKLTTVTFAVEDTSTLAEDFADDGEGEYDVRTRVSVEARAMGGR